MNFPLSSVDIQNWVKPYIPIVVLCALYFLSGRLGLSFHAVNGFATFVWPPTGVALAALLLYGNRLWPGITLGAFLVNISIGAAPLTALDIAIGNTLEIVLAVYLLKNYGVFDVKFSRMRDSVVFVLFAAILAPFVSATVGVSSLLINGVTFSQSVSLTWVAWWMGDALGMLVFGPLLLVWLQPLPAITKMSRVLEALGLALLTVALDYFVFWNPFPSLHQYPFLYAVFIPLSWAALRFGIRGKTLAIFITSAIAIAAVVNGHNALDQQSTEQSLLFLQIYIGTTAAMFLLFGSIVEERRKTAEELKAHIKKLQDAFNKIEFEDEAKKEFLALLAHELRNPLAPVLSGLEIIRHQQDLSADTKRMARTMREQIRTMIRLVDDLLDISRISQKKLKLQKELVELHRIVKNSVKTAEPMIKKAEQKFVLTLPEASLWFEADPVRLEQVIVNVLTNASKYTAPGGHINCKATLKESTLTLSIRDNGVGIPPDMLERIFEPFLQVERTKKQGSGIGVGLSLTRYLVEMHGGSILAHSDGEGKGSEFVITLPLKVRAAPALLSRKSSLTLTSHPHQKDRRVLVVDDNEAAARGIGILLEHKGYKVAFAFNGQEALRMSKKFRPDIILLDIGLPDMSGHDVARRLRTIEEPGSHIVLIALTGFGQAEDKEKAHQAGFDYHVTKPVGITELHSLITSAY